MHSVWCVYFVMTKSSIHTSAYTCTNAARHVYTIFHRRHPIHSAHPRHHYGLAVFVQSIAKPSSFLSSLSPSLPKSIEDNCDSPTIAISVVSKPCALFYGDTEFDRYLILYTINRSINRSTRAARTSGPSSSLMSRLRTLLPQQSGTIAVLLLAI